MALSGKPKTRVKDSLPFHSYTGFSPIWTYVAVYFSAREATGLPSKEERSLPICPCRVPSQSIHSHRVFESLPARSKRTLAPASTVSYGRHCMQSRREEKEGGEGGKKCLIKFEPHVIPRASFVFNAKPGINFRRFRGIFGRGLGTGFFIFGPQCQRKEDFILSKIASSCRAVLVL